MHKKKFLKLPEYPGGKEEFRKYILGHLVYPEKALQEKIEGIVYVSAQIDDNGEVLDVKVEKGLGYGCDEEAVRLIQGLHFGGVKNQGIRLKTRKKFRIEFKLKKITRQENVGQTIAYSIKKENTDKGNDKPGKSQGTTYGYTINFNTD
jgi:TonB family protein